MSKEMKPEDIFCGLCGVKNLDSHNFCTSCGKRLKVIPKVIVCLGQIRLDPDRFLVRGDGVLVLA